MADGARSLVPLSRIVMRLARNPGTEFADGDDHRGYTLVAPLTADGHLDAAAYAKARGACTVRARGGTSTTRKATSRSTSLSTASGSTASRSANTSA